MSLPEKEMLNRVDLSSRRNDINDGMVLTDNINSLKQFETRLDKFRSNQDVMFDWTAEITGTRDRSEFKLETVLESTV